MKKLAVVSALLMLGMLCAPLYAQTVPGTVNVNWTNPTTTVNGLPLTGANALTEIRVFVSTAPIADNATTPTVTVTTGTTANHTLSVTNGQTIYARIQACNKPGGVLNCGDLSPQVSKAVTLSTKPGVPSSVSLDININ